MLMVSSLRWPVACLLITQWPSWSSVKKACGFCFSAKTNCGKVQKSYNFASKVRKSFRSLEFCAKRAFSREYTRFICFYLSFKQWLNIIRGSGSVISSNSSNLIVFYVPSQFKIFCGVWTTGTLAFRMHAYGVGGCRPFKVSWYDLFDEALMYSLVCKARCQL